MDDIQEDQEVPTPNRHDRVLILDGLNEIAQIQKKKKFLLREKLVIQFQ